MVTLDKNASFSPSRAYLNRVATAVPEHECHQSFLDHLEQILPAHRASRLRRIAAHAGIERRYSVLPTLIGPTDSKAYYRPGQFPSTGQRMETYREHALGLAMLALERLALSSRDKQEVTHLIITSCTGFYAPGLDIDLVRHGGFLPSVHRTLITYMGCYAAISGLRMARDILRSQPQAKVLMVNLELCSLHLQQEAPMDRMVSYLLFGDGCAVSLLSCDPEGLELIGFHSMLGLDAIDRMSWMVQDKGFEMTLDKEVPQLIQRLLDQEKNALFQRVQPSDFGHWAIHPGGRAILDSVQSGLGICESLMEDSRQVLKDYGNMSSATVMFVLESILRRSGQQAPASGLSMAFGPGLTIESMEFCSVRT